MSVVVMIPARMESTRLPGKPLLAETGKPLIQHTWEQACKAKTVDAVYVVTDSPEIYNWSVDDVGAKCIMMTGDYATGTDRIASAVKGSSDPMIKAAEIIVNVQVDEPEIDPDDIDRLVLYCRSEAEISTLVTQGLSDEDESVVKVVCSRGRAIYFSRSNIPYDDSTMRLLHIGVYAYRRDTLLRLSGLPRSPLELCENLEQLRAIEAGIPITVVKTIGCQLGINTRDDYDNFVRRQNNGAATRATGLPSP